MNEQSSREAVLAAVVSAVAGLQEPAPAASARAVPAPSSSALVERFIERAEAADAFVSVAADWAGALQRVADILCELEAGRIIVSDAAWQAPWDIARLADVLEEDSIRPTSSLDDSSPAAIAKFAHVGISAVDCAIAETGTVVVASGAGGGRIESLLPPVHIALLTVSRLLPRLEDGLGWLARTGAFAGSSAVTFVTGPSRTADIELTLTIGVHGPKQLFVVLVNDTAGLAAERGMSNVE